MYVSARKKKINGLVGCPLLVGSLVPWLRLPLKSGPAKSLFLFHGYCANVMTQRAAVIFHVLKVFYRLYLQLMLKLELCADEPVVGGGVGLSYVRRRRRRQTGRESTETAHSLDKRFFLVLQRSATSPVISARPLAPKS